MDEDLLLEAMECYAASGALDQPSSSGSTVERLGGEDVAVLRNVRGVLAVYKRGSRGMAELIETSAFDE